MHSVMSLSLLPPPPRASPFVLAAAERITVAFMGQRFELWVREHDHISRVMKASGKVYEHELLERLHAAVPLGGVAPTDLYLDIGAFIGTHAMVFAAHFPASQILAIEPERQSYRLLCCNASNASDHGRIMVMRAGCGKEHGERTVLRRSTTNGGMTALRPVDGGDDPLDIVDLVRIDDLVGALTETVGLIKIDVEGMEGDVLEGAAKTLATMRPVMVIELQTPAHKRVADRALSPLRYQSEGPYCATPTYIYWPRQP